MLVAPWHFSFTVGDIERSILFYRDTLGLELVHRQEQANAYTRKFVGYPDAHLRVAQFRIAAWPVPRSGHLLELVEYVAPRGVKVDTRTLNPGTAHLAFEVEDLAAEYERLRGLGVRFRSEPVAIEAGINRGGYTVYFLDPDDITLEMIQPPPRAGTAALGLA
ncbi:MAG TPA: VOC family protein [Anaerolineae bacterium]